MGLSWTQPMCWSCWLERNPRKDPVRLVEPVFERCAWCGRATQSGIYVRIDPVTVPYPREAEPDDA